MEPREHNWSGWPGAYCLNCFIDDPFEECLAHDGLLAICDTCKEEWPTGFNGEDGHDHDVMFFPCAEHKIPSCPPEQEK